MSPSIKEANQFLRWMYTLQEQSELLLEDAANEPLEKVIRHLTLLSSKWKKYIEHAERVGLSLHDYREPTQGIIRNLERTQKVLRKRKLAPTMSRSLEPVWPLLDDLDKVIVALGYRPVCRPVAEACIGGYIHTDKLLNSPLIQKLLPQPVTAVARTTKPQGEIERVWSEHNNYLGKKKGMTIHVKFRVHNLSGVMCRAVAYFRFSSGEKLADRNNAHRTTDGQVAVGEEFTPRYKNTIFDDFSLFLPYSELHLIKGKHNVQYCVSINIPSTSLKIAQSEYYNFEFRRA